MHTHTQNTHKTQAPTTHLFGVYASEPGDLGEAVQAFGGSVGGIYDSIGCGMRHLVSCDCLFLAHKSVCVLLVCAQPVLGLQQATGRQAGRQQAGRRQAGRQAGSTMILLMTRRDATRRTHARTRRSHARDAKETTRAMTRRDACTIIILTPKWHENAKAFQ
jgi:hypothetical protein